MFIWGGISLDIKSEVALKCDIQDVYPLWGGIALDIQSEVALKCDIQDVYPLINLPIQLSPKCPLRS